MNATAITLIRRVPLNSLLFRVIRPSLRAGEGRGKEREGKGRECGNEREREKEKGRERKRVWVEMGERGRRSRRKRREELNTREWGRRTLKRVSRQGGECAMSNEEGRKQ